jgi:signal peptidase II
MHARTILALVAIAAYAVDLGSKILVVARLTDHPDVSLVGDLLVLHLTRNAGAAFSTGTEYTIVLSCFAILALLVVLWISRRVRSVAWAFALGLLVAGIAGNLTDRLFRDPGPLRGHVIDFLMMPHWPVFNVADMCINVAAGLILLQAFRGIRLNGSRVDKKRPADTGSAA